MNFNIAKAQRVGIKEAEEAREKEEAMLKQL